MNITLPLDCSAIERILPHRYPFLLVDRITEFEPDKRIVGIKNVTLNERYLAHRPGEPPVLPPTILTEAVAQVGAILILAKPENRDRLTFFVGIERVRYRRPVHPGDVVEIEARRQAAAQPHGRDARHRARPGAGGRGRHDDVRLEIAERRGLALPNPVSGLTLPKNQLPTPKSLGVKCATTFTRLGARHVIWALGVGLFWELSETHPTESPSRPVRSSRLSTSTPPTSRPDESTATHRAAPARAPAPRSIARRSGTRLAIPRVSRSGGPVLANADARVGHRREHVEGEDSLRQRRVLVPQVGAAAEQPLVLGVLDPEARRRDDEFVMRREPAPMRDGEERDAVKVDLAEPGRLPERGVGQQVAGLMGAQPKGRAARKEVTPFPVDALLFD